MEQGVAEAKRELDVIQKHGALLKEEIDAEDVAAIVSRRTGIPVARMLESERSKLLKMEDELARRVIGQREAIEAVSNAVRRGRAGLQEASRPIVRLSFLAVQGLED